VIALIVSVLPLGSDVPGAADNCRSSAPIPRALSGMSGVSRWIVRRPRRDGTLAGKNHTMPMRAFRASSSYAGAHVKANLRL
jgi:hypothetical protein